LQDYVRHQAVDAPEISPEIALHDGKPTS